MNAGTAWHVPHAGGRLNAWWERFGGTVIWVGVAYSVVAAVGRLRYALPYLVTDVEEWAAVDFKYRYEEVARWFDGLPVYGALERLTYPPATYALLWPAMGWLPAGSARVVWLVTTLAAAVVVALVAYRMTEGRSRSVRMLAAVLPFAAYPLQVTVFVGQLPMHVVALVAAGTLVLVTRPASWATDATASLLLAASAIKPTLAPPLVLATLIATRRWRPALLTAAVYGAMTLAGAAAQPEGLVTLARAWLESSANPALVGGIAEGVPSMHMMLSRVGAGRWAPIASLAVLVVFAVWAWRHQRVDAWVLVGVGAIVARLWSYHREYDDAVLLLAAVALLRLGLNGDRDVRWRAGFVFVMAWAALLTPTWLLFSPNVTLARAVQGMHTVLWVAVLVFLIVAAHHRNAETTAA